MGFWSFLFGGGKYPTTSKYEHDEHKKVEEYERYKAIGSGAQLKRHQELLKLTTSDAFTKAVDHLKYDRFEKTPEYDKEQELRALQKDPEIKDYVNFIKAGKDKNLENLLNSKAYADFQSLSKIVGTPAFMEKAKVKNSPEWQQQKTYDGLRKSDAIRSLNKILNSSQYANYKKVKNSDRLKKMETLTSYVNEPAFKAKKADLQNKNRFKQSQEYATLQELAALNKDKDLLWYYKQKSEGRFNEADKWKLIWKDDFEQPGLNKQKWSVGYYWGRKVSDIIYSLADERQKFTEKNAQVQNGVLTIATVPEKVQGDVWRPMAGGFVKGEMDCTSSLVNTAEHFRLKFGRIEVKAHAVGATAPVTQNIWLSTEGGPDSPMREINLASFGVKPNTIRLGVAQGNNADLHEVDDLRYQKDYYIYTLEWTPVRLTWKVNGVEVWSTAKNVPQEPMYIAMSSNAVGQGDITPANLQVEWVHVYSTEVPKADAQATPAAAAAKK